jgi:hypothetical protein
MTDVHHHGLTLGATYSRRGLSSLLGEPTLGHSREGIFYCTRSSMTLLLVDLEKQDKENRFHFNDYFESEFFHWDSQPAQHLATPRIRELVDGTVNTLLFARRSQKIKRKTQPFVYCGRLEFAESEPDTAKPAHLIFRSLDYDDYSTNDDLLDLYLWEPKWWGKTTTNTTSKSGEISADRRKRHTPPTETERSGLTTSRVGQGWYRQEVLEKWGGRCPVTGLSIRRLLIASHIVPWSDSTDDERLDPDNGILLSPNVDALFDRHLLSFTDEGEIVCARSISEDDLRTMGIDTSATIRVSEGMRRYLSRHRERSRSSTSMG